MNTNAKMFWILFAFFIAADVLYVVWSLLDPMHHKVEWVGTVGIGRRRVRRIARSASAGR